MKIKNLFLLTALFAGIFVSSNLSFASLSDSSEISCAVYGSAADSCNQCFDGGTDYAGDTQAKAFDEKFINNGTSDLLMYRNGGLSTTLTPLQSGVQVGTSSDYGVAYTPNMFWFQYQTRDAAVFLSGDVIPMAQMHGGILITSVSQGNPNAPAYRFEYNTSVQQYDFDLRSTVGSPLAHKECVFVSPRWCGDGIVASTEMCDEGSLNGTPGHCNALCTNTVPVVASCDSITVNPTSGTAPLAVNVTCSATNASSYRIDCGNGITNLTSTATCNYGAGDTYTPRCTINGNITSPSCTTNVTVNTPAQPLCSSTITGLQSFPITEQTQGICTTGIPVNFSTVVTGNTSYNTWNCTTGSSSNPTPISPVCSAHYESQPLACVPGPTTGPRPTPVTAATSGLCPVGQPVTGFDFTVSGNTTNYTWGCGRSALGGRCIASHTPLPSTNFDLSIKKYVNNISQDAQDGSPVTLPQSSSFNYIIRVTNNGPAVVTGMTTVSDPGPAAGVNFIGTPSGSGWNCSMSGRSITCLRSDILSVGNSFPDIIVPATTTAAVGTFRNLATVSNPNENSDNNFGNNNTDPANVTVTGLIPCVPGPTNGPRLAPLIGATEPGLCPAGQPVNGFSLSVTGNTTNYVWACGASTIGGACIASHTPQPPTTFDLSIKKYVNSLSQDAQDGNAVAIAANTPFNYIIRVINNGPATATGMTTVSDPGPAVGVDFIGTPSGAGWSCSTSGRSITCTRSDSLIATAAFPDIIVPATTTGANGTFRNLANVSNPNENPTNNFGNNNTDPANVTVGPIVNACVPGTTTGAQVVAVTAATANLCPAGQAVGGFATVVNPVTGTNTYTWSCNGSAVGGLCTANFTPIVVNACVAGTTTGPQAAAVTAATPNLCPAGQAVGAFTTVVNPVTGTNTYTWSCNGSAAGGACAASFTPSVVNACVPGATIGVQAVAVTAATAGLCPAGQAVGGFTTVVAPVTGTNTYTWSCNGSAVGGACTANFTSGGGAVPICATLTSSIVAAQTVPVYSSVLTCAATAAAGAAPTYQINCGNGQIINAATGTCNYTAFGVNAASCSVNSQAGASIPNSCRVNVSSFPPGSGPGSCQELTFSTVSNIGSTLSVSMGCTATAAAGPSPTIEIDCGNGGTVLGASGICSYNTGAGANFPYTATCRVNGSTQGAPSASPGVFAAGSCRQSIGFSGGAPLPTPGGGSTAYCGNGVIDSWTKTISWSTPIPGAACTVVNRTEIQNIGGVNQTVSVFDHYSCIVTTRETCDAGMFGGSAINNPMCIGCMFAPSSSTLIRANPLFISYYPVDASRPRGLPVNNYQWIIGNNVPVFESGDRFTITSPFPTILSGYSATMENNSGLLSPASATVSNAFGSRECIGTSSVDFGTEVKNCVNEKTIFTVEAGGRVVSATGTSGRTFVGNSASITTAAADVNPPLSTGSAVLQNNFTVGLGYLREPLRVRVSRQAVSNTAGGNAYIGTRAGYSVNAITKEFLTSIETGNFVVTSSSKTSDISLSGADGSAGTKPTDSIKVNSSTSIAGTSNVTIRSMADFNFANFSKMGDASNIYVLPKGTVTIDSSLMLEGIGTLLIEEGTLVINGNITYRDANSSWAFVVVKPGSTGIAMNIKNTVETISGVYMALDGKMSGSSASIVQLAVDGNVYANLSDLVNSRTFIRATEGSSALSTGVTINYSTRAFKNPPPLLSKYLEQYTLKKISR